MPAPGVNEVDEIIADGFLGFRELAGLPLDGLLGPVVDRLGDNRGFCYISISSYYYGGLYLPRFRQGKST